jgi:hypothetical protein
MAAGYKKSASRFLQTQEINRPAIVPPPGASDDNLRLCILTRNTLAGFILTQY